MASTYCQTQAPTFSADSTEEEDWSLYLMANSMNVKSIVLPPALKESGLYQHAGNFFQPQPRFLVLLWRRSPECASGMSNNKNVR